MKEIMNARLINYWISWTKHTLRELISKQKNHQRVFDLGRLEEAEEQPKQSAEGPGGGGGPAGQATKSRAAETTQEDIWMEHN